MTTNNKHKNNPFHQKGQSLVEIALFLPIFLVIIAGLVEVSNILVTQNSVHNATRVGTRFGSNGGQDEGMAISVQNTVTDVLQLDENLWDMWTIRGRVNDAGTDFTDWQFTHVFGNQATQVFTDVVEADIKEQVLEQLQTDEDGNTPKGIAGELTFVGMYVGHEIDSILGLNALEQYAGVNAVRSLSVMRRSGVENVVTDACEAFPIVVKLDNRSVLPPGETGGNAWRTDFDFPTPAPNYFSFVNHIKNIPLKDAQEGFLYYIQNGAGESGKGWLCWNTCACSQGNLESALTWPGNSNDHNPANYNGGKGGGNCPATSQPRVEGFIEMGDATDTTLQKGDWVPVNTGSVNSNGVRSQIEEHIDLGRTLRVIVYDSADVKGTGSNQAYKVNRFAIMRLHGYSLNQGGGESFILAEFIRWDESCGNTTE